ELASLFGHSCSGLSGQCPFEQSAGHPKRRVRQKTARKGCAVRGALPQERATAAPCTAENAGLAVAGPPHAGVAHSGLSPLRSRVMAENVFEELKRYVNWTVGDEADLRGLYPFMAPDFEKIATVFYDRILKHEEARKALDGGESSVGRLKITLVAWMDKMLKGPWDDEHFDLRC